MKLRVVWLQMCVFKILFFLLPALIFGMPVLNPASPQLEQQGVIFQDRDGCWGLKLGYRCDSVQNRQVKSIDASVRQFSLLINEAVITLNIFNAVELYGFVGSSSYTYTNRAQNLFDLSQFVLVQLDTSHQTLAGGGFKACLCSFDFCSYGRTYLGADVQYEIVPKDAFYPATIDGTLVNGFHQGFKYHETQLSLGVAHRMRNFCGYIAGKWSMCRGSASNSSVIGNLISGPAVTVRNFRSQNPYGFAVGMTYVQASRVSATLEARFGDESAYTIAADFRF